MMSLVYKWYCDKNCTRSVDKEPRGHSMITSRYFAAKLTPSLLLLSQSVTFGRPPIIMSQPSSSSGGRFPNCRLQISPLVATIFSSFSGNETSNWGERGWPIRKYLTFMPDCRRAEVRIPLRMGDCDLSLQAEVNNT